jgi:protein-disulfide isomerase
MNNKFVIVFAALVALFIGFLIFNGDADAPDATTDGQLTNHVLGAENSNVTFVEYSDFECPACYGFFPIISELKQQYGDRVTFQFRHFPLVEIHQNALLASRAAEAASKQDKFWDMHTQLFVNQPQWSQSPNAASLFEDYARQIGLDVEQYKQDLRSDEVNRAVQADRAYARDQGFNSTPTFVLNGEELTDVRDTLEYFTEKLDEALAQAEAENENTDAEEPSARTDEETTEE